MIDSTSAPDEDWAACAYRAALEVFARDGWDEPEMDAYDVLDPRRASVREGSQGDVPEMVGLGSEANPTIPGSGDSPIGGGGR